MTANKNRSKERSIPRGEPLGGFDQKRIESRRISEQIAAFENGGGHIEKLGTTRVLHRIDAPAPDADAPGSDAKPSP